MIAFTDVNGNVLTKTINSTTVEIGRFAYDPWGARRDPSNWTIKESKTSFIINRGYTGHEHLDAFGIINMNGRVYDPLTAMFFSPDPTMTDAGNWLDYNKYSYCLNNPFKYTDPSGYTWWAECWKPVVTTGSAIIIGGLVGILTAGAGTPVILSGMLAGAAGGFTGGSVGTAVSGGSFSQSMVAGFQGAVIGGIMGGITAGIGSAFGPVGSMAANATNKFNVWNELGRAGVHALAQGGFSAMRGGNFWQGAASGLLSSFGGTFSGVAGITDFAGIVGVSTAMGGIGSVIAGAKSPEEILFGMVQGAMVGALNGWMHDWEKRQVQRIYDLLVKTKDGGLTYKDLMKGISTYHNSSL